MSKQSQRIALQMQRIYAVSLGDLLKIDLKAANYKNIAGICFKLMNDYRINSQMFQLVNKYKNYFCQVVVYNYFVFYITVDFFLYINFLHDDSSETEKIKHY